MKTYRYKMYTKAKNGRLGNQIDRFGIVYNHCIALHRRYYKLTGKSLSRYELMGHLTKLKRRTRWLGIFAGLDAQAVQQVAERIDKAYKLFFRNLKHKVKTSPPKFKAVKKYASFTLKQTGYKFENNKVRICGVWYGFHKSRDWKGKVKTVTIKRDRCGDYWIVITTDWNEAEALPKSGKSVGYDFGMKTFLVASDYRDIEAPLFMQRVAEENDKVSRAISSKVLGSNNRRRAVLRKARFMRRLANQRADFQWKLANRLVREYDILCFEDLNLRGMAKQVRKPGKKHGKKRFGRKIGEYGFAEFLSKLEYKARIAGKEVRYVPWNFPSSQLCHVCGYKNAAVKDLNVRKWVCPKCGTEHDRDHNAAMNVYLEGTSSSGRGSSKSPVSRSEAVA